MVLLQTNLELVNYLPGMEKQTKFLQFDIWAGDDDEKNEYYLVIIEIKNGIPSLPVLISKYSELPTQFSLYPYVIN